MNRVEIRFVVRVRPDDRWALAETLAGRNDFAADQNIPLMIWYVVEPLVTLDLPRFASLAVQTEIPLLRRHISRRIAEMPDRSEGMNLLVKALAECRTSRHQSEMLEGILKGLEGVRAVKMPEDWTSRYVKLRSSSDANVREQALRLALIFDDADAILALSETARSPQAPALERTQAIDALVAKRIPDFGSTLLMLIRDEATRRAALRGLAQYNHPDTVSAILEIYSHADAAARQDALQTLAARPAWARAMFDAIIKTQIPRKDVTAFTARQIHSLGDKQLSADVDKFWGQIRETPRDRVRIISEYKRRLTPDSFVGSNRGRGRVLFAKTCGNCHRLFDAGAAIGPDLTGAQRTNIDYLLLNLIDPSSSVSKDFQMQIIETTDGRVITGLVVTESDNGVTIQTPNDKVVVPVNEIEQRVTSGVSMMPEGMLQRLTPDEVRDLFAYLTGPDQVPESP